MVTLTGKIRKWASRLPYWEQVAFKKVIDGEEIGEKEYEELVDLFLEDIGLMGKTGPRPEIFGNGEDGREYKVLEKKRVLSKLFDVNNVNALVEGQEINFSPQITILFGHNRTGKTGYFRVIACSAHQRGIRDILPDVYEPGSYTEPRSAKIEITDNGDKEVINLKPIEERPELSCFYIYDALTEDIHISGDTPVSFVPRALADLKSLAEVYDLVLAKLKQIVEDKRKPHEFSRLFREDTEVARVISYLSCDTDLDDLGSYAELNEEEILRSGSLEKEIGRLKGLDVNETLGRLKNEIKDLERLNEDLERIKERLNEKALREIEELITKSVTLKKEIRDTGQSQFESVYFKHVGSEEWITFVRAAESLGEKESEGREPYPQDQDVCLLCRQSLTEEAIGLIRSLWHYLRTDLQADLAEINDNLDSKRKGIQVVEIPVFDRDSAGFRLIEIVNPELAERLYEFLSSHHLFQVALLGYLATEEKPVFSELPDFDLSNISELIIDREKRIKALEEKEVEVEIRTLSEEYNELKDRLVLKENLEKVSDYVNDLRAASTILDNMRSTAHITRKYNQLFEGLVTGQYERYFAEVLEKFGCFVKVKVGTKGKKGETVKFLTLDTPVDISESGFKISEILSEGEKRAVTLADFLTEVVLNESCTGIILDDPTTGLDRDFKEKAAELFVKVAKIKQLIIFTHDLVFLSFMDKSAESTDTEMICHWIQRGGEEDRPGYVSQGESPCFERRYKDSEVARSFYKMAKDCLGQKQERFLRDGFEALRNSYEVLIMNGIINNVISRWDERVRYNKLKEVVGREDILDTVLDRLEYLSRFIQAHSHSAEFDDSELTPRKLLDEIEFFERVKYEIKEWKSKVLHGREAVAFKPKFS